jgi:LAS superfamily LD-carboxypeptidase LdcB
VPDGVTVFDDEYPGVANLDPDLLQALREAATDAADDGIEFYVNSGWRSPEYQNQLLREAVSEYGPEEEAARWVATADTSAHVSGDAVDIGSFDATAWLSERARSTATSPGTTNCAPRRSIVVALPCMPTPRTIRGCSSEPFRVRLRVQSVTVQTV